MYPFSRGNFLLKRKPLRCLGNRRGSYPCFKAKCLKKYSINLILCKEEMQIKLEKYTNWIQKLLIFSAQALRIVVFEDAVRAVGPAEGIIVHPH